MFQHTTRLFGLAFSCKCARLFSVKSPVCHASMKILNVAEKNDAAKHIAQYLSNGKSFRRDGLSPYNKIYEFECEVFGQNCLMIMTSVSGHLLNYEFDKRCRNWEKVNPVTLFDAPLQKVCEANNEKVKKNLEKEIKYCSKLIIWTDCDREGENIGFEIIEVCRAVKPNITVHRAKFSEITYQSVKRSLQNLETPNKHVSDAVNVRQQLDLRIGAAFTRFQTLLLKKAFPNTLNKETIVSYGSCQFPTLGFVVERFKQISEFIPESFWQINVKHTVNDLTVDFAWQRNRLFNKLACEVLYDKCKEKNLAVVENVNSKPTIKRRPKPLDTVALEKLASSKLKISAKETLNIAEKLYSQGLISYPRTETNIFPKELNLVPLVQNQTEDPAWGDFARRVLEDSPNPFQGNKTDNAHPPIHPINYSRNLSGNELKIYQFIVRHFLACLSKHAEGLETTVDIDIAEEKFVAKGLMITAKNYLEVYPYEKWSDKEINIYQKGDTFVPEIEMNEGKTTPPKLLTEADLIALMEKHGIGTDATHAEHIEKIKSRLYVGLQNNKYFIPRTLGMGLVEGYINMGHTAMTKPDLRAELESDLQRVCENQKTPDEVLKRQIEIYRKVFVEITAKVNRLVETVQSYLQVETACPAPENLFDNNEVKVCKCPSCSSDMVLSTTNRNKKFVSCTGYPQCREAWWFPSFVLDAKVTKDTCPKCGPNHYLIKFKFDKKSCYFPPEYVGCIGGCDINLREVLGVNNKKRRRSPVRTPGPSESTNDDNNDSGIGSMNESPSSRSANPQPNSVKCNCGGPAVSLKVKKQGPSFGRKFYSCDASINSQKCGFFQWEDELPRQTNPRNEFSNNFSRNVNCGEEEIRCYCAIVCRRCTVQKQGPNLGRQFFACGKPMQNPDRCNFFKWTENNENSAQNFNTNQGNQFYNNRNTTGGNNRQFGSRTSNYKNQPRKKKCGVCGEEGHNRKNCSRR